MFDLQVIRKHLVAEIKVDLAKTAPLDAASYRHLLPHLLARIMLFNAKRGGEIGRMTIENLEGLQEDFETADLAPSEVEKTLFKRCVALYVGHAWAHSFPVSVIATWCRLLCCLFLRNTSITLLQAITGED